VYFRQAVDRNLNPPGAWNTFPKPPIVSDSDYVSTSWPFNQTQRLLRGKITQEGHLQKYYANSPYQVNPFQKAKTLAQGRRVELINGSVDLAGIGNSDAQLSHSMSWLFDLSDLSLLTNKYLMKIVDDPEAYKIFVLFYPRMSGEEGRALATVLYQNENGLSDVPETSHAFEIPYSSSALPELMNSEDFITNYWQRKSFANPRSLLGFVPPPKVLGRQDILALSNLPLQINKQHLSTYPLSNNDNEGVINATSSATKVIIDQIVKADMALKKQMEILLTELAAFTKIPIQSNTPTNPVPSEIGQILYDLERGSINLLAASKSKMSQLTSTTEGEVDLVEANDINKRLDEEIKNLRGVQANFQEKVTRFLEEAQRENSQVAEQTLTKIDEITKKLDISSFKTIFEEIKQLATATQKEARTAHTQQMESIHLSAKSLAQTTNKMLEPIRIELITLKEQNRGIGDELLKKLDYQEKNLNTDSLEKLREEIQNLARRDQAINFEPVIAKIKELETSLTADTDILRGDTAEEFKTLKEKLNESEKLLQTILQQQNQQTEEERESRDRREAQLSLIPSSSTNITPNTLDNIENRLNTVLQELNNIRNEHTTLTGSLEQHYQQILADTYTQLHEFRRVEEQRSMAIAAAPPQLSLPTNEESVTKEYIHTALQRMGDSLYSSFQNAVSTAMIPIQQSINVSIQSSALTVIQTLLARLDQLYENAISLGDESDINLQSNLARGLLREWAVIINGLYGVGISPTMFSQISLLLKKALYAYITIFPYARFNEQAQLDFTARAEGVVKQTMTIETAIYHHRFSTNDNNFSDDLAILASNLQSLLNSTSQFIQGIGVQAINQQPQYPGAITENNSQEKNNQLSTITPSSSSSLLPITPSGEAHMFINDSSMLED
jgi:hypothetical protein